MITKINIMMYSLMTVIRSVCTNLVSLVMSYFRLQLNANLNKIPQSMTELLITI